MGKMGKNWVHLSRKCLKIPSNRMILLKNHELISSKKKNRELIKALDIFLEWLYQRKRFE